MYLFPKCSTEFGERNPINVGIKLALDLAIDVSWFQAFRLYNNVLNKKI